MKWWRRWKWRKQAGLREAKASKNRAEEDLEIMAHLSAQVNRTSDKVDRFSERMAQVMRENG